MSNQDITTHKFAAVLNKKVEAGKILNVVGHMSVGLVAKSSPEEIKEMGMIEYMDKDGGVHGPESKNSYVILKADNSNQLRTLRNLAIEKGLRFIDFTNTMQEGTYVEQIERTKQISEMELEYYGVLLFGKISDVSEITRKFSLWQ